MRLGFGIKLKVYKRKSGQAYDVLIVETMPEMTPRELMFLLRDVADVGDIVEYDGCVYKMEPKWLQVLTHAESRAVMAQCKAELRARGE